MSFLKKLFNSLEFPIYLGLINLIIISVFTTVYYLFWKQNPTKYFNGLDENSSIWDILYFTTTTQSTIGYGDITPKDVMSRMVVILQQVLIVVGALISLEIIDDQ